jgi:excisionase family DNA binding protein
VAAQPAGKAATTSPGYLRASEVADILHVSPKTVSRWAKEGKLPFLKTLGGGHRRDPEAEIRKLAQGLREEATTYASREAGKAPLAGRLAADPWQGGAPTGPTARRPVGLDPRHPSGKAAPWPRPATCTAAAATAR